MNSREELPADLSDAEVEALFSEELPAPYREELTPVGIQYAMFEPAPPAPKKGRATGQLALW